MIKYNVSQHLVHGKLISDMLENIPLQKKWHGSLYTLNTI